MINRNAPASNPASNILVNHNGAYDLNLKQSQPNLVNTTQIVSRRKLELFSLGFSKQSYRCNYVKVKKGLLLPVTTRKAKP